MKKLAMVLIIGLIPVALTSPVEAAVTAEAQIGTGVENREPTGVADSFASDAGQLVGWTKVEGAEGPTEIQHVWIFNGKELVSLPLSVKSSSFRTWSRKNIDAQIGQWRFEVRDATGAVLASKDFTVTAAAAQ